jgi:hypothetical protein
MEEKRTNRATFKLKSHWRGLKHSATGKDKINAFFLASGK